MFEIAKKELKIKNQCEYDRFLPKLKCEDFFDHTRGSKYVKFSDLENNRGV